MNKLTAPMKRELTALKQDGVLYTTAATPSNAVKALDKLVAVGLATMTCPLGSRPTTHRYVLVAQEGV